LAEHLSKHERLAARFPEWSEAINGIADRSSRQYAIAREFAGSVAQTRRLIDSSRQLLLVVGTDKMNRGMVLDCLTMAERHVAKGGTHLERQRVLFAKLTEDGHPEQATQAAYLLVKFEETHAFHVVDRDRLIKELAEVSD
jgi:hypothetical protein